MAESIMYNTTTLSLFSAKSRQIFTETSAHLSIFASTADFPLASNVANSPILGVPSQLYQFVLEVSHLSLCMPLSEADLSRALALGDELESWKTTFHETTSVDYSRDAEVSCVRAAASYVIALNVLLYRITNDETQIEDTVFQTYLDKAVVILGSGILDTSCRKFFCWPLLVIGSLAVTDNDIEFFRCRLKEMWTGSYCGEVAMTQSLLERVWKVQSDIGSGNCSGLDLLLGKAGMPGLSSHAFSGQSGRQSLQ